MEQIERKKLYKAGKNWMVAALVTGGVLLGANASVHADEVTPVVDQPTGSLALNVEHGANGQLGIDGNIISHGPEVATGDVTSGPQAPAGNQSVAPSTSDTGNSQANPSTDEHGLTPDAGQAVKDAGIDPTTLTKDQVNNLNKINFTPADQAKTGTRWTYDQYRAVANDLINQTPQYRIPYFNAKLIKNMPATHTLDAQTGKVEDLDVWDSWAVQDEKTGLVSNWNGYQLAVAMMGMPNKNDLHIYLLYNKYGDNDLAHWKNAGPIFGFNANEKHQQWSGSATLNKDGSIQLFYTDVDTLDHGWNNQKLATANLVLKVNPDETVSIDKVQSNHVIFTGDGYHYQTFDQWKATNKGADNICMRDAHVIQGEDGHRYLVFEASTGTENYQGENNIYNWSNYGDNAKTNIQNYFDVLGNKDEYSRASWANAALGIVRLNDNETNPSVDQVFTPLVTSNMVSDEIERPDVVKLGNKYYLFAATRLNRGTGDDLWQQADEKIGDNVVMLGWVSDSLTGGYKPLNGTGIVLASSVPFNWRTSTYSYYAVPIAGDDSDVLITAYMTNRGYVAGPGKRSTWSPSFLVKINKDGTTQVLNKATNQGDWIWDEGSYNPDMIVDDINQARLDGEKDAEQTNVPKYVPGTGSGSVTPGTPGGWNPSGWPSTPSDFVPGDPDIPGNPPATPENPTDHETPTPTPTPDHGGDNNVPGVPTTPAEPGTPVATLVNHPVEQQPAEQQVKLPQTGNENLAVAGLAAASLAAMFGLSGLRKREN